MYPILTSFLIVYMFIFIRINLSINTMVYLLSLNSDIYIHRNLVFHRRRRTEVVLPLTFLVTKTQNPNLGRHGEWSRDKNNWGNSNKWENTLHLPYSYILLTVFTVPLSKPTERKFFFPHPPPPFCFVRSYPINLLKRNTPSARFN